MWKEGAARQRITSLTISTPKNCNSSNKKKKETEKKPRIVKRKKTEIQLSSNQQKMTVKDMIQKIENGKKLSPQLVKNRVKLER